MTFKAMRLLGVPVLMVFSACASTPTSSDVVAAEKTNSLSARTLAPGECGLFVWTADADKRFILFSQSQTNSGFWKGADGEVLVGLTTKTGAPTDGQYPQQTFEDIGLTLLLKEAEVITQGTRYKGGTLSQISPEGWNRVTPVVGLSACQIG